MQKGILTVACMEAVEGLQEMKAMVVKSLTDTGVLDKIKVDWG